MHSLEWSVLGLLLVIAGLILTIDPVPITVLWVYCSIMSELKRMQGK